MSNDPVVSVVIATRDRPEMLREAIAAVHAQEGVGGMEVIVVFDQSTPDSSLKADEPEWTVRVVANDRSVGLAGARNTGILAARGKYVAFCDDDDFWLPDKLRMQVSLLEARPDRHCASIGILVEYDNERHERSLNQHEVDFRHLLRDRLTELHPSTLLFRREALLHDIGLVSEEVPGGFGEDYELLLRASRHAPILVAQGVGVVVRWHKSSFFFQRWATMADGLSYVLRQHPEIAQDRRGHARLLGQIGFAQAAQGQKGKAMRTGGRAMKRFPFEPRVPLTFLVGLGVISPARIMTTLHRYGRGI